MVKEKHQFNVHSHFRQRMTDAKKAPVGALPVQIG
jgi:hypothetical protein